MLKQALSKLPKALQGASASSSVHSAEHTFAADSALQLALLSCACELVSFLLVDPQQLFPAACRRMASSKLMLEIWEAVQLCLQHLEDPTTPAAVLHYLAFMRMRILDEYALAPGSTIYDAMLCGPQTDGKLYGQVCSGISATGIDMNKDVRTGNWIPIKIADGQVNADQGLLVQLRGLLNAMTELAKTLLQSAVQRLVQVCASFGLAVTTSLMSPMATIMKEHTQLWR